MSTLQKSISGYAVLHTCRLFTEVIATLFRCEKIDFLYRLTHLAQNPKSGETYIHTYTPCNNIHKIQITLHYFSLKSHSCSYVIETVPKVRIKPYTIIWDIWDNNQITQSSYISMHNVFNAMHNHLARSMRQVWAQPASLDYTVSGWGTPAFLKLGRNRAGWRGWAG